MTDREKIIEDIELGIIIAQATPTNLVLLPIYKAKEIVKLLKEQEVRELTMDEWREWKANPKRNPICELWENDTSPMWILNPNNVHEPALLMGKLKLFTGKPTFEQCKAVKWRWV